MNTDTIPWGLLFLAGAKFLMYITDQITQPEKHTETNDSAFKKREMQYIVNGKPIDLPHSVYYLQILGLLGNKCITDTAIKKATKTNYEIARDMENGSGALSNNIVAASYFLLDQWRYCTSKN